LQNAPFIEQWAEKIHCGAGSENPNFNIAEFDAFHARLLALALASTVSIWFSRAVFAVVANLFTAEDMTPRTKPSTKGSS